MALQRRTQQLREEADSEKSESLPERYTSNSNKEVKLIQEC